MQFRFDMAIFWRIGIAPIQLHPFKLVFLALPHLNATEKKQMFFGNRVHLDSKQHSFASLAFLVIIKTHSKEAAEQIFLIDRNFLRLIIFLHDLLSFILNEFNVF